MAKRYAEDPRTVILCVIPANSDISTSEALQMAMKVDRQGLRTIGVLTKIDIMDKGTNAKKAVLGEEVPLRLGYIGVKLRCQADITNDVSVKASLAVEKDFFARHPIYASIPTGFLGTDYLTVKLTKVLFSHIRTLLPEILKEILTKMKYVDERLRELGP